jgi:glycosyltransferase involved in cell wall biosynthesis
MSKEGKMRIAWTSNAPWTPTGYGVQTSEIVPLIAADGHEIAIMANYGLGGSPIEWNGIPVMPTGLDSYSNDVTPGQIGKWFQGNDKIPALAMTLYDVWVYTAQAWDEFPIACWTPIDHKGLPIAVAAWFNRRKNAKYAIAMSKFGEQELLEAKIPKDDIFYAPHSYNPNIYKVQESAMRKDLQVPDDAHLTMVNSANKGNNPVRKSWSEMLAAWAEWANGRKDAFIYIHTESEGIASGVNLPTLLNALGVSPEQVRFAPQLEYRMNIPAPTIASLYAASDVLLMPSRGEGFGVPLIESQACGTPVITTDWTAMTELCGAGWLVEGQKEFDHHQGGWWKVPFISSIKDALQASYELKRDTAAALAMREKAADFAKGYATPVVWENNWRPILAELERRLAKK